MSRLGIGTAQFGSLYGVANKQGQVQEPDAQEILHRTLREGVNLLDTAMGYGESEATLGRIGVKHFQVVTKLPTIPKGVIDVAGWMGEQVASSLSRLRLDSLYGLLLHRSEDLKDERGHWLAEELHKLKLSGTAQKVGVSIYDPSELDYVTQILNVDLVQAPLNLVDRRLESSGWLSRLKQMGVEVHTRSAFLQGLLLMPRNRIPERFERWFYLWDEWARELVESRISPVEACLGYPLSHPEVDRVVVGVDSLSQLKQLLHVASKDLGREGWDFMAMDDEQLINPSRWSEL